MQTVPSAAGWRLSHTYAALPAGFYAELPPTPVAQPRLVVFNGALARRLGLEPNALEAEAWASIAAGNALPEGAKPLAQAYAGHQFGHFNRLGDGRALLLGEQLAPDGLLFDVQLKGSGPTPYSRRGDGRATLSAMLREYLISEAMHGLGIATSRSLAVAATGEPVYRDDLYPGAVLVRVAQSHLRVGTFEYARHFMGPADLEALVAYALRRHYPHLAESPRPAHALLAAVIEKQLGLVADWMRVGFIHGVMNTDNMSISGETIDYGPCAFMNAYHPQTVFSSIDTGGRYAFGRQPQMAHWNLSALAGALLPLLGPTEEEAMAEAQALLSVFAEEYPKRWYGMLGAKLGLRAFEEADRPLADALLQWMASRQADYTETFRRLSEGAWEGVALYGEEGFRDWLGQWQARVARQEGGADGALMRRGNPAAIPRNHRVEEALAAAVEGDMGPFDRLLGALRSPYEVSAADRAWLSPPPQGDAGYRTFCGT
jgi:uncharacterized protein YdiU (UPF0061 family)